MNKNFLIAVILAGLLFSLGNAAAAQIQQDESEHYTRLTYNEGEYISYLEGARHYAGIEMKVLLNTVIEEGGQYRAVMDLYTADGELVDSETVLPGAQLQEEFVDSQGRKALKTKVAVPVIAIGHESEKGYIGIYFPGIFSECDHILTLYGRGQYSYPRPTLHITVDQIAQYGTNPSSYRAVLSLYYGDELIDTQTVTAGTQLNEVFVS